MPEHREPFCELLKLAIDHAPNDHARAEAQAMYDKHCSGVVQDDTGDNGPPPKQ